MSYVQYMIKLAESVVAKCDQSDKRDLFDLWRALAEELDRLDPRDFLPGVQFDFVLARVAARKWAQVGSFSHSELPEAKDMANSVINALKNYGGDGSRAEVRTFSCVKDVDLRKIIERDYRELRLHVYPSGAWKSTVILAGSILEALLFDRLSSDPAVKSRAEASPKAPCRSGTVKDLLAGDWTLAELIAVAIDVGVLPANRASSIDQVLRDYRNFVHPKKEIRSQHQCTEAEAMMAVGALDGVCNILASHP